MKLSRGGGKLLVILFGTVIVFMTARAATLEWVGASGGTWDATTQNWKDENGNPSAWVAGSTAVFGDNGGANVTVSGTISLGGLVFNGTTAPTISGGTLSFASQMPIDMQTYKGAIITSALTLPNGFVVDFVKPTCAHPDFLECRGTGQWDKYAGATNTIWRNCRLEDLDIKSAYIYTWRLKPLFARAYNHRWMNGELQVQFQYDTKGSEGLYCVIVHFAQDGDDVTARIAGCCIYKTDRAGNLLQPGDDLTTLSGGSSYVLDGIITTSGLGVKGGEIVVEPKAPLQLNGSWTTPVGTCVVSNGALQVTGGQHTFDTGDKLLGNGTLIIKNTSASSFTVRFMNSFVNGITGSVVVDGALLYLYGNGYFTADRAFGPGCQIRVINGGMIHSYNWAHNSFGGNSDSGVTLYIGTNSTLKSTLSNNNIKFVKTVVDGGTIRFNGNPTYQISDLTLRNGAQIIDEANSTNGSLYFGVDGQNIPKTPRLTVDGESEVTVAGRIRIFIDGNAGAWNGDNQYTTFDTRADLRLTGGILTSFPSSAAYTVGRRLRKCGAAKLIFDFSQDDYPADTQRENTIEVCVDRGTLELRKSNAIVSTQALSLYGEGAVTSAADVSTDVALLTVGGTNTLDFAAGSALTCNNLTFTSSAKKLNLTGEVGERSFRVGTSKCLTNAQLRQVKINGRNAVQDADGYLALGGFIMVFR